MAIKKMLALFFCFVLVFLSVIPAYAVDEELPFGLREDQVLVFSYAVTELSDFFLISESDLLNEGSSYSLYVYAEGKLQFKLDADCVSELDGDVPILLVPFLNSIVVFSAPVEGTILYVESTALGASYDMYLVQNYVHIPDVATSGISVVVDWVGIVLGAFLSPSGVLFPLFVLLLVGVSISLLLFVIKVFRLFFWGF